MHIQTPISFTCHRWLTCAACVSLASAEDEEAHLVARADRAAGRRESRHRYLIDHGSVLFQHQRAQQQPGQGSGWPSGRCANRFHVKTSFACSLDACTSCALDRFKLFASDLDGDTATTRGRVAVQSAWSGDVGDGRNRYMRPNRSAGIARLRKSFY